MNLCGNDFSNVKLMFSLNGCLENLHHFIYNTFNDSVKKSDYTVSKIAPKTPLLLIRLNLYNYNIFLSSHK